MRRRTIGTEACQTSAVSRQLEEVTLNCIREVLPDRAIEDACRHAGHRYRRRVLTPIVTVLHVLLAAIWPEESFAASWQLLWDSAVGCFPALGGGSPSSGSVAKARARLPLAVWQALTRWLSAKLQQLAEPFACWRGHRVVLADGTCVSMPDTPQLMQAFGTSNGRYGRGRYPLARLVTLCLANTFTVISYALGRYDDGESKLLMSLLPTLRSGDLLVGDRHFAGANLYARYLHAGVQFLTRAHPRLKIGRLRSVVRYAANDFVADVRVGSAHRRRHPSLPASVRVRLIQAVLRIRAKRQVVWFVTSLLDAASYPADEIVRLYGRRWRIETLFRQVKLRLSADVLRSRTPDGVRKEVAARLMALNVLRCVMIEAAIDHAGDPAVISFAHAVRAVLAFASAFATAPPWKLPILYEAMLLEIAAHQVPLRPGRLEPRALRRETKHYPRLKSTRAQWKLDHAA